MNDERGDVTITLAIRNPGKKRAIKVASKIWLGDSINIRAGMDDAVLRDCITATMEHLDRILKTKNFRGGE